MFQEFEELINNIESMDDEMFEALMKRADGDFNNIFNYEEIGRYTKISLDNIRDMCFSHTEYENEIAIMRQAFSDMRDTITKHTTGAKYTFLMRMIENLAAAVETAINETDYYHVHIGVETVHPNAKLPTYAHDWDAGADVYAVDDYTLASGETKIIPTGLKVNIPRGWMLSVRPRSGMSAKTGIRVANAPGTVDTGYLDEVGIILTNTSNQKYEIHKGDRIAQFVVERKWNVDFLSVDSVKNIADIDRSNIAGAGFGSTGA